MSTRHEDGPIVVVPCIDGAALADLADSFERGHDMTDPAGGYGGLIPEFLNYGPLDRYFLGKPATEYFVNRPGRIFVLGCRCGEVGCWPLTCDVGVRKDEIVWSDFEQPHRPRRDYSGFGPFVFGRSQYGEALKRLLH